VNEKKLIRDVLYEAVNAISEESPDSPIAYKQIFAWIENNYGSLYNKNTITAHLISDSVNIQARVNYAPNKKARIINCSERRDWLYHVKNGVVVKYDPDKHGTWKIRRDEITKKWIVEKVAEEFYEHGNSSDVALELQTSSGFAFEEHLRDYLAENLGTLAILNKKLTLIEKEYTTGVGSIDILAQDDDGNFYVFELKRSKGMDRTLGQILRYMGWLISEEAEGKKVYGIIVAEKIDEKLKYAMHAVQNIDIFEYKIDFRLENIAK